MHVRIDGLDEPEVEFGDQLQVAVDMLTNRVDEQRFAARAVRE